MPGNTPHDGKPGTTEQSPRWEGPAENRPRGYLPAEDDPYNEKDAAGETLKHPDRQTLADAVATKNNAPPPRAESADDHPVATDPAFSSELASPPAQPEPPPYKQPPKDTQYAGHPDFSQDAAKNDPPAGIGNSKPVDDVDEKTRHSDGVKPSGT